MSIDDVIGDFAHAGNTLPRAAMRWALDNWDTAAPRFVTLLGRCADGVDRTEATKNALFFIIHLLGEKGEAEGFPALCRLLEDGEASEFVLGDAITETLRRILVSTYNGDPRPLKNVIESTTADEFARAAALDAMAYLTRIGRFTDDEMRRYLLHLRADMRPQAASFVWTAWALTAANLGYRDFAGEVEKLFRLGFIPYRDMDMDDFDRQLRRTVDDPNGLGGFDYDRVGPFTDAIGTLSTWYGFSEQFKLDQARRAARREHETGSRPADGSYVNPLRHVGRNDPCPCGSGKKYKKCCLR